ncbi:MAG: SDR family oxidoreductase [Dethiobacteria bacterium]
MYLVTGGAGFIGSNIVRRLTAMNVPVRIIDDFSTGKRENLEGLTDVELIEGTLLDSVKLKQALTGVDYVIHQGAIPSVPRSIADPIGSNEANVTATLKLLDSASRAGIKRFVYAASSSAYGDTAVMPKVETMTANPLSPYAVSKYAGELYVKIFAEIYNLPAVSLRYFNIFGPYQDPGSEYAAVIPKFINLMLKGESPVIYGDGEQSRDFTHIDNAVEANLLACTSEKVGRGEVINVACGERITLNELVGSLNEILGTDIKPVYTSAVPGDVKHSLADISKANELLDYEVKVDFKEGLKRTVKWFKSISEGSSS